jgi:hypothetical protein
MPQAIVPRPIPRSELFASANYSFEKGIWGRSLGKGAVKSPAGGGTLRLGSAETFRDVGGLGSSNTVGAILLAGGAIRCVGETHAVKQPQEMISSPDRQPSNRRCVAQATFPLRTN